MVGIFSVITYRMVAMSSVARVGGQNDHYLNLPYLEPCSEIYHPANLHYIRPSCQWLLLPNHLGATCVSISVRSIC